MTMKDDLITELTSLGFITAEAPLTGGVDLLLSGLSNVIEKEVSKAQTMARAYANLTGGGTVIYGSDSSLFWSKRFVLVSMGHGSLFSTSGYFDIYLPPNGTVIPGYGGASDVTVTSSGILIPAWEALYYELPIGENHTSQPGNFRMVSYLSGFDVPDNWLLLATRNNDSYELRLSSGVLLQPGQQWTAAGGVVNL